MWSEKHRPQSIIDMMGNEDARASFVEWFGKWKKGTKPLLLVGPPGIGKTTLANLAAKQFGYDMISLNASDVRNKNRIEEILSPILGNASILGSPMIFVDEVDGIYGKSDYGGAEALIKILKKILKKENAKLSPGSLIKIISESRGDLRSMINSAQAIVTGFEPVTGKSFESLDVESGVNAFFKANSIDEARSVLYSLRIDPREKINAFYSSVITSSISKSELDKMLQVLSQADMLFGKIMRTQQWRLLRYLDEILIGLYQKDSSVRYSHYNLSWPLLNRLRWDGKSIKELATILAKNMHISRSTFGTLYFPYMLFCIKNKKMNLDLKENFSDIIEKEIEKLA